MMSSLALDVSKLQASGAGSQVLPQLTTRRKPSIATKVSRKFNDVKNSLKEKRAFLRNLDNEEEEPQKRCQPDRLEVLCLETGLSKQQMRSMYRAFKQECPSGAITENVFRDIYCQLFPLGADGNAYAHYIFKALDKGKAGTLAFSEFVRGFAKLVRGSLQERLHWVFRLYDIDHDGAISREEMSAVIGAIHDLLAPSDMRSEEHTNYIFQKMDLNCDGVITIDEFLHYCYNNEEMCSSLETCYSFW